MKQASLQCVFRRKIKTTTNSSHCYAVAENKLVTFHCFRHTYATLQMAAGTDIFTVSKMMGHKSIKTTQIYTKIIDEKKR